MNKFLKSVIITALVLSSFSLKNLKAQTAVKKSTSSQLVKKLSSNRIFPKGIVQDTLNGPTPWQVVGNMYSQPNIHIQVGRNKLDWYGSGDVNNRVPAK